MATYSEVKVGLDNVAAEIRAKRAEMVEVVAKGTAVSAALASIPTKYADLVATIQAYGTTNAAEAAAKAELAKLSAEYTALKTDSDVVAGVNLND